jgi:hypothetical protein
MAAPVTTTGSLIDVADGGVIGEHDPPLARPFFASPTRSEKSNALALDIVPMACLNLGDVLFEFDSSIVLPAAGAILSQLPALRRSKPNAKGELPLVSIFGHADPSGNDEYNKTLAGRRAKAVFGLLTHKAEIWDELFCKPFGGDDWTKKLSVSSLAQSLGLSNTAPRRQVFAAHIAAICPEALEPRDFLGRGVDGGGKADFQGCGEFNPLLLASAPELKTLSKVQRDNLNLINRRVVVFLFRPEIRLNVQEWPCPRATESTAGCRKRFFLNAKERLTPAPERKRHQLPTDETFACRFYDRIAGPSPCEQVLEIYRIRLFDKLAKPLPGASFTLSDGKRTVKGTANSEAFITVRDLKVPTEVHVEWSVPGGDGTRFTLDVHVEVDGNDDAASFRRLHNLGYEGRSTAKEDILAFQQDHQARFPAMSLSGNLDAATRDALKTVNDECTPSLRQPPGQHAGGHKNQGDKPPEPTTAE